MLLFFLLFVPFSVYVVVFSLFFLPFCLFFFFSLFHFLSMLLFFLWFVFLSVSSCQLMQNENRKLEQGTLTYERSFYFYFYSFLFSAVLHKFAFVRIRLTHEMKDRILFATISFIVDAFKLKQRQRSYIYKIVHSKTNLGCNELKV
jgi:hypothetical protein